MKKTIIALFALGSIASAADFSYTNLFSEDGWNTGSLRGRGPIVVADGTASISNSNWSQSWANKALSFTMTEDCTLTFNVEMGIKNTNLSTLFILETTENAFLIGKDYDENKVSYGKGAVHAAPTYAFDTDLDGNNDVSVTDQKRLDTDVIAANTSLTLSGTISWDGDSYSMDLSDGTNSTTWDLGVTSFELTEVGFYADGANGVENVVWSNLAISGMSVPEPTTATLSLLALAGLAARRRRK